MSEGFDGTFEDVRPGDFIRDPLTGSTSLAEIIRLSDVVGVAEKIALHLELDGTRIVIQRFRSTGVGIFRSGTRG